MKKHISLLALVMVSGIVIGSQVGSCDSLVTPRPRVRFASDITVCETRSSSESDASAGSLSPKTPRSLSPEEYKTFVAGFKDQRTGARHYPGYYSKLKLTVDDVKSVKLVVDSGATLDTVTGFLDSPLSPDELRDIKHQVRKDELSKKAPFYKKCLLFLGCTPHLRSSKSE
jgi:hypothetical protein